ncbi:MAG: hypothetical protein ABIT83_01880 [Massilia sp.]
MQQCFQRFGDNKITANLRGVDARDIIDGSQYINPRLPGEFGNRIGRRTGWNIKMLTRVMGIGGLRQSGNAQAQNNSGCATAMMSWHHAHLLLNSPLLLPGCIAPILE